MRSTPVIRVPAVTIASASLKTEAERLREILKNLEAASSTGPISPDLESLSEFQQVILTTEAGKEKERMQIDRLVRSWQEAKSYLSSYLIAEQLYSFTGKNVPSETAFILAQKVAQNELNNTKQSSKLDRTPLCTIYYFRAFLDKQPLALSGLINYFAGRNNKFTHEIKQELVQLQSQRLLFPLHHPVTINSFIRIIDNISKSINFPELKIILLMELLQGIAARSHEDYESEPNSEIIHTMENLIDQIQSFSNTAKQSKKELGALASILEEKLVVARTYLEELRLRHKKTTGAITELDGFAESIDLSSFGHTSSNAGTDCEKFICNIAKKMSDEERILPHNIKLLKEECYQLATRISMEYSGLFLKKQADPKKAIQSRDLYSLCIDRNKISDLIVLLMQQQEVVTSTIRTQEFSQRELLTLLTDLFNKIEENPEIFSGAEPSLCYDYFYIIARCLNILDLGFGELRLTVPQLGHLRDACVKLAAQMNLKEFSAKINTHLGKIFNVNWFGKISLEDFLKSSRYFLIAFFQGEEEGMLGLMELFSREEKSRKPFQRAMQICKLLLVKDLSLVTELTGYRTLLQELTGIVRDHFGAKDNVVRSVLFELRQLTIDFLLTKIHTNPAFSKKEFLLFKDFILEMELQQPNGLSDITLLKNKFLQIYAHFAAEEKDLKSAPAAVDEKKPTTQSKNANRKNLKKAKKNKAAIKVTAQIEQIFQVPIVDLVQGSAPVQQEQIVSILTNATAALDKATTVFEKAASSLQGAAQENLQAFYKEVCRLEALEQENNYIPLCLQIISISQSLSEIEQEAVKLIIAHANFLLGRYFLKKFEKDRAIHYLTEAHSKGEFDACIYLQKMEDNIAAGGENTGSKGYVDLIIGGLALQKSKLERFSQSEKEKIYGLLLAHWCKTTNYASLYLIAESLNHLKPLVFKNFISDPFVFGQTLAHRELDGNLRQTAKIDKSILCTVYYLREFFAYSPRGLTALINYYAAQNNKAANAIHQELLHFRSYCFLFSIEEAHIMSNLVTIIKAMSKAAHSNELKIILYAEMVNSIAPHLQSRDFFDEKSLVIIETLVSQILSFIAECNKHSNPEQQGLASHLEKKLSLIRPMLKELRARVKSSGALAVNAEKPAASFEEKKAITAAEFEELFTRSICESSAEERLTAAGTLSEQYFRLGVDFFNEYLIEAKAGSTDTKKLFKAEQYTTFGLNRNKIDNFNEFLLIQLVILKKREPKLEIHYRVLIEYLTDLFNAIEENPALTNGLSMGECFRYIKTMTSCLEMIDSGLLNLEISLPQLNSVRDRFVKWASGLDAGRLTGAMHLKLGQALTVGELSYFLRASFYYLSAFFHGEKQGIQQLARLFNIHSAANANYKLGEKLCQTIDIDKLNHVSMPASLLHYKELFQVFDVIARENAHFQHPTVVADELFALQKLVLVSLLRDVSEKKPALCSQKEFLVLKELIDYVELKQPKGSTEITLLKKQFLQQYPAVTKKSADKILMDDLLKEPVKVTHSKQKKKNVSKKKNKSKSKLAPAITKAEISPELVKESQEDIVAKVEEQKSEPAERSLTSKEKRKAKKQEKKKDKAKDRNKKNRSKLKAQQRALQKRPDVSEFDEDTYFAQTLLAEQAKRKQADEEAAKLKAAETAKEVERIKEEGKAKAAEITTVPAEASRLAPRKLERNSSLSRSMSTIFNNQENQPSRIPVAPIAVTQKNIAISVLSASTSAPSTSAPSTSAPSTSAPSVLVEPIIIPLSDQIRTILSVDPQNNRVVGGFVRESIKKLHATAIKNILGSTSSNNTLDTSDVDFTFFAPQPTTNFPIPPYIFEYRESNKKVFFKCRVPEMDISFSDKWTLFEDAKTRDFTINALYLRLRADGLGEVEDPLGLGLEDLKHKRIRFINPPEQVLKDDPIVIFRFLELMVKGYHPHTDFDPRSLNEYFKYLDDPKKIHPGQIYHRLIKACVKGRATASMDLFQEYGLFQKLFPSIDHNQFAWLRARLQGLDQRTLVTGELNVAAFFALLTQAALRSAFVIHEYTDAAFNAHFYCLIRQMPLPPLMQTELETNHMLRIRSEVKDYLNTLAKPKALPTAPVQLSQNRFTLHRSNSQFIPKPTPDLAPALAREWMPKRPA